MDTREIIFKTSQELFGRFGFNKTTVDEIANAAHIAKSTLYNHFASKEDIFRAVIEREGQTLAKRIRDSVASVHTPQDKLRAYVITRMVHLRELANFYSALRDSYLEHYSFIESVRRQDFENEMAMFREILTDGVRKKVLNLKDRDVEVTAQVVITALKGLEYPWNMKTELEEIKENAEVMLRLFFHGILAPGA